jgi:hypothetical protein
MSELSGGLADPRAAKPGGKSAGAEIPGVVSARRRNFFISEIWLRVLLWIGTAVVLAVIFFGLPR